MTKTAPSAVAFASNGDDLSARPHTTVQIGSTLYDARAPKFQVWWDVVVLLEDGAAVASEALRRLAEESDKLSEAEQAELVALASGGGLAQIHTALIYGLTDEFGRVKGGFLRRCLKPEDWQKVMVEIDDDDSDLDLPDLYQAALTLQQTFTPWFKARTETMGLPTPEVPVKGKAKTRRS